ncbi:hypothetical protein AWH04_04280 [Rhodococcus erythropolis]|nr:hypothetical protein AWH04_04280 [Rhodococcus erythropolis]
MYRDLIRESGDSKLGARRHVGELLAIKPATRRNWIEDADRSDTPATPVSGERDDDEIRCRRRKVAELHRAKDILMPTRARTGPRDDRV